MRVEIQIREKLFAAFHPIRLDIVDDSARHVGHAGARAGGESHFNVVIVSAAFAGMSRVERSRCVHAALADELKEQIHALTIRALAPEEDTQER